MRVRAALTAAVSAVALVVVAAGPATAGTGASQFCGDGVGKYEVPLPLGVVTVGVELYDDPTAPANLLIVCYSTTAPGTPSTLAGGAIYVPFGVAGPVTSPVAYANIHCFDDAGPQAVDPRCDLYNSVAVTTADLPRAETPSVLCVLNVGGSCLVAVPGLKVTVGGSTAPTAVVTVLGVATPVNVPRECVQVLLTGPC